MTATQPVALVTGASTGISVLRRLEERVDDRAEAASPRGIAAQLKAILRWEIKHRWTSPRSGIRSGREQRGRPHASHTSIVRPHASPAERLTSDLPPVPAMAAPSHTTSSSCRMFWRFPDELPNRRYPKG
jgi:hypothetical protein